MSTSVKNEEFLITYDTRIVAKIFAIQPGYTPGVKSPNLSETIIPVIKNDMRYLPASVEIIDLYNILYTGIGYDENILNTTNQLSKLVIEKTGGDIKRAKGANGEKSAKNEKNAKGANGEKSGHNKKYEEELELINKHNPHIILDPDIEELDPDILQGSEILSPVGGSEKSCYEKKKNELEAIKIALLREYFKDRYDIILIGTIGYNWSKSGNNICPNMDRIQIITALPINDLKNGISQYLNGIGRNYKITVSDQLGLMIPKDFRTKKTIFSMIINTAKGPKEKPFLEVFNNATFELIPASIINDMLIGSKYVLLRFLYIDLWISNFVYTIGRLTKDKFVERQTRILNAIRNVSTMENIAEGVLGTYYDYDVSKKELIIGQEQYFGPYNVDMYYKKNKKVRKI
jgi:hypothetical protein